MARVPSFMQEKFSHHLGITQEDTFCRTDRLPVYRAQLFVAFAHVLMKSRVGDEEDYVRNVESRMDQSFT